MYGINFNNRTYQVLFSIKLKLSNGCDKKNYYCFIKKIYHKSIIIYKMS